MIHYHGTPTSGGRLASVQFLQGRHALIPYPRRDDMELAAMQATGDQVMRIIEKNPGAGPG